MTKQPDDRQLWENGCLTRWQLEHWSDEDLQRHSAGVRTTLKYLFNILDRPTVGNDEAGK